VSERRCRFRCLVGALTGLAIAFPCGRASALNPERVIAQLHHTAWTAKDGAPSEIVALAQTADGFLWLGTGAGLFRFDGVTFERFAPESEPPITTSVSALLGVPSGELFIGSRFGGVRILKDGRLSPASDAQGLPVGAVYRFVRDHDGVVWAATFGGLARFDGHRWHAVDINGPHASPRSFDVSEDRRGNLWADNGRTLVVRRPGARDFVDTGIAVNRMVLAVSPMGTAWIEDGVGPVRLITADGRTERPSGGWRFSANPQGMIFDRDGSLWVATIGHGVQRIPYPDDGRGARARSTGPPELFTHMQGLTTDFATSVFEDREGSIWVGTRAGLDRFRESHLAPVVIPDYAVQLALGAADDGSVFIGSYNRPLMRVVGSTVATERVSSRITCIARDPGGALWLAGPGALWRRQAKSAFVRIELPAAAGDGDVQSMVADRDGTLWVGVVRAGLFRLSVGRWTEERRFQESPTIPLVAALGADHDTWFGYPNAKVVRVRGGRADTFTRGEGVPVGDVTAIFGRRGHVWIGGPEGLGVFDGTRFRAIGTRDEGLRGISGIVETADRELWVSGGFGVARIAATDVTRALADPRYQVDDHRFDFSDGLSGVPQQFRPLPSAVESRDGRLWFSTIDGVVWVDPKRLPINPLAPPVVIRSVTANARRYGARDGLRLPIGTRDLQIDYTALSLSIPERVQFRFRLDGADRDWHEAGPRRQAFYTNLRPGAYRFRVIAANNDGVWNDAGATVQFAILPAFYQTSWFVSLSVAIGTSAIWGLYRIRVRQVANQTRDRLEARLMERVRIARELHDTLLQSFHGALFRFQAAVNTLPERPAEARQRLHSAIDRAAQAITEGREAIQDLRASALVTNDLAVAISTLGDELATSGANGNGTVIDVSVQGTPRDLHPILRDDIYRIAGEAVRNAFHHAHARRIEVEITYDDRQFRLQVRDDGKGIDKEVLADDRRGHFGLPGICERAELVGGHLDVWSEAGAGTEIDLTIPAGKAYSAARASSRARWFAKKPTRG
jgi:signal transduction histidine kinase/ligand-binding sensor domain-containing protein